MAEIIWHNEKRAIRELIPYEANPRQITDKQAKDLKASLAKFGIADPLIINTDNMIIGGHQRKKILETLLGYDPDYQIDVRVPDRELSIDEARELNVRLNKNVADWDFDILANNFELDDLLDWGFDKGELDLDLWAEDAPEDVEPQIDKAEELRVKWGVESGQLWQLGEHRLVCGDCTDKAVVERVMGGERADMVFTDPPYNVAYQDNESIESLKARNRRTDGLVVSNDSMTDDEFDEFLVAFLDELPLIEGGAFYLCAPPGRPETQFRNALECVSGLTLRECIVWVKDVFVFGRQDYHWRHESILYGWKDGAAHYFVDDHTQDTVWEIDRPRVSKGHPTMKPVELPEKAIRNSSRDGAVVFDGFLGSGTTLIACERLGRKCRAVEISPAYVAVAIQRWVDVTGGEPVMLSN